MRITKSQLKKIILETSRQTFDGGRQAAEQKLASGIFEIIDFLGESRRPIQDSDLNTIASEVRDIFEFYLKDATNQLRGVYSDDKDWVYEDEESFDEEW
jgi:hypothetical protein